MANRNEPGKVTFSPLAASYANRALAYAWEHSANGRDPEIHHYATIAIGALSGGGSASGTTFGEASNVGSGHLTVIEAAARVGCSSRRIRALCEEHRFPGAIKRGRQWFVPEDDVDDYRFGGRHG